MTPTGHIECILATTATSFSDPTLSLFVLLLYTKRSNESESHFAGTIFSHCTLLVSLFITAGTVTFEVDQLYITLC